MLSAKYRLRFKQPRSVKARSGYQRGTGGLPAHQSENFSLYLDTEEGTASIFSTKERGGGEVREMFTCEITFKLLNNNFTDLP
jgi:hypothetical protein